METWKGVGASQGVAIGPLYALEVGVTIEERRIAIEAVDAELSRLDEALVVADIQLQRLQEQLNDRHSGEGHEIVAAHRLMLSSCDLVDEVRRLVRQERFAADWAVRRTIDHLAAVFARLEDRYFRERGSDVEAVGERLLRVLLERPEASMRGEQNHAVAVCVALSPLDPFQLKRAGAVGIASDEGGKTSHAAILAQAFGLPYVAGLRDLSSRVRAGDTLVVDGTRGEVVLRPDAPTLQRYRARQAAELAQAERLRSVRSLAAETLDGVAIHLAANLECLPEIPGALDAGAESVGLFRTEFLYLERSDLPSEDEQYQDAVAAVRALGGRTGTFRTLDLGGDKLPGGTHGAIGHNPALGMRSIRLSLARPGLFRTQLRALYRASAVGPIRIMFPLISGVTELAAAQRVCEDVCAELTAQGEPHDGQTPIGSMIETPSAAWTVDHLAQHCDFFSVGTNDLIQYAFAADRQNEQVGYLYQPLHPAVLRSLKQIVDICAAVNRPVSICGDVAGDPAVTWILLGLGFRDLSMAPRQIPRVKALIRATSLSEAQRLCATAMLLGSEIEVEQLVLGTMAERFGPDMEPGGPASVTRDVNYPLAGSP